MNPSRMTQDLLVRSQLPEADVVAHLEDAIAAYRRQPNPHPEVVAVMTTVINAMPTVREQNERSNLASRITKPPRRRSPRPPRGMFTVDEVMGEVEDAGNS